MAQPLKILLIDDNDIDVKVVQKLLEKGYEEPYRLISCSTLEEGKRILENESPEIVLLDLHLPDSSIDQTIDFVARHEENFPFVILSSIHERQQRIRAIQKGAQDYLIKNDFDAPLLARVLNYSIERHRLHKELHAYAKELKEKEQRLTEAQAIAQIGNWELLPDNNTIEWSQEARVILETDDSNALTTVEWFSSLLHEDDQKKALDIFRQAVEENRDFNMDFKATLPGKKTKYLNLRVRSTPADNESGKKIRGTIQDITARKQMEAALKSSEERYHRLFEESADAIWITSEDGKFVDFNPATVELFGYTREELKELNVEKLYYNPYDRERARKLLRERGTLRDYEIILKKKDGSKIDCIVNASFWRSNDGRQRGFQGIIRDITEKKRNEELLRNKEIAERSSRLKQRFLANMSHEIRTPITSIAGLTHLILKTELTPQQRAYVEGIKTSADHLLALVNDILDFSKIEEGKIKFHSIEFSPEEHIVQLMKTMEFTAQNKGLELLLEYDPAIPKKIVGDPVRLNQILFNLLSNAIKFTDKGYVKVKARLIEDGRNAAVVSIAVEDTGIGIPENKSGTIFRSFTQLGKDVTKTAEGTGLGLAITKQLVELQGGSISVKSKVGEGSVFEVVMMFKKEPEPAAEAASGDAAEIGKVDIGYKKILIAEDKKLNQLVTSEMLKSWWKNIEIEFADDGRAAIGKLKEKKFDLVLMDVQMPVMDGYEATRMIREEMKIPHTELPILGITAYNTDTETRQCLEAGMNDFLMKPF
ncbi:MAG TPA: response regulator, partial [Chitinophagales bacterium]|nr:response regulator [Chitinophagales bacterium]